MFENVVYGTDSCDEGDLWTLNTVLRGLPLVCKIVKKGRISVNPSVTDCWWCVGLSCKEVEEESGVAQSISQPAPLLNAFAITIESGYQAHVRYLAHTAY